ncbi:neuropeptide SIFamide receptor-like [Anabrus simplex]|uniref:neuropeptide SIFamide receptor-like n=1 Tax=Anabrus simplex TaxID=316456 RepID=UPI0035A2D7C3
MGTYNASYQQRWGEYNESSMLLNLTGADVLVILEFRHSMPVTVFFCVAYTLVFVVGVIGNCFVVVVVYRSPRMRSPTNLFIVNLAFADLLVNVLCLPFTLVGNLMSAWIMGWVICKTVPYLQGVSVSASINTLVAISVERCLAICYPMRWQMTSRACRVVVIVIWLFSLTITLPWAVVFGLQPLEEGSDMQICIEHWPSGFIGNVYFVVAHLVMCYLFPLVLISVCYLLIWRRVCRRTLPGEPQLPGGGVDLMIHRSKVKVIKMLLVVVVSFALSWLPLYVLFTRVKFGGPPSSEMEESLIHALLPLAQWLGASNSCVNPILYAFFNRKFRAGFHAIITSRTCCGTLRYSLVAKKVGKRNQESSNKRRLEGSSSESSLTSLYSEEEEKLEMADTTLAPENHSNIQKEYDDSFAANSSTRSSFKYKLNKPATGSANMLVTRMTISSSSGDRCKTHLLPATNNNNNNSTLLKRKNDPLPFGVRHLLKKTTIFGGTQTLLAADEEDDDNESASDDDKDDF